CQAKRPQTGGVGADSNLLRLILLHRQRSVPRQLLSERARFRLWGFPHHRRRRGSSQKREPRGRRTGRGARTISFASTSVVKAVWPPALPLTRRADSRRRIFRSGRPERCRTRLSVPRSTYPCPPVPRR